MRRRQSSAVSNHYGVGFAAAAGVRDRRARGSDAVSRRSGRGAGRRREALRCAGGAINVAQVHLGGSLAAPYRTASASVPTGTPPNSCIASRMHSHQYSAEALSANRW